MANASKKQTAQARSTDIKPNQSRQTSIKIRSTTVAEWGGSEIID